MKWELLKSTAQKPLDCDGMDLSGPGRDNWLIFVVFESNLQGFLIKKVVFSLEKGAFVLCKEMGVRRLMSWGFGVISSEQEPELDAPDLFLAG